MPKGSSPRIRGKSAAVCVASKPGGIIPANTGKIWRLCSAHQQQADHPREYGENSPHAAPASAALGSSPRIRGKFLVFHNCNVHVGIIPANTGKIVWGGVCGEDFGDHPREYGENQFLRKTTQVAPGSSPRIRGKSIVFLPDELDTRIIPANTGKITGNG